MPDFVTLEEIEGAVRRIAGVVVRTPLVQFPESNSGRRLLLKPESLQPTGSFKLRGATNAINGLRERQALPGVVAHSSGNHAQAVAYAAGRAGVPAVLVMPHTAPAVKVAACQALGAEVVFVEPMMEARVATAERLADAHGYALVPPFDDLRVIAGQGTIGMEIVDDAPETKVVLVPVSGGGLISGIALAIKTRRPDIRVIGVEPERAADARDSLRLGARVAWPAETVATTIADALRVDRVGALTLPHMARFVDGIVTVSDDEIKEAMRGLAVGAHLVAEPGGAAATAAYLFRAAELPAARTYVAVVSGGNVDQDLLAGVLGG